MFIFSLQALGERMMVIMKENEAITAEVGTIFVNYLNCCLHQNSIFFLYEITFIVLVAMQ